MDPQIRLENPTKNEWLQFCPASRKSNQKRVEINTIQILLKKIVHDTEIVQLDK